VRPLHRVHDRVETRSHQVAQMSSPAVFALHVHSDSEVDAQPTLTGKSWFLVLRPVISTLYCRHLATDAEKCRFLCELRGSSHAAQPPQLLTGAAACGSRFTYGLREERCCTHRACTRIGLEFHHALRLSRLYRPDVMIVCESGTALEKNR
jgi:hypothetical protein